MHYRTTVVIGLVASLLIAIYPLRVGAAGDAQVVQQVSANGQRNLRPFTVKDKWEFNGTPKVQC
jgi:hypothetical protein